MAFTSWVFITDILPHIAKKPVSFCIFQTYHKASSEKKGGWFDVVYILNVEDSCPGATFWLDDGLLSVIEKERRPENWSNHGGIWRLKLISSTMWVTDLLILHELAYWYSQYHRSHSPSRVNPSQKYFSAFSAINLIPFSFSEIPRSDAFVPCKPYFVILCYGFSFISFHFI